MLHPHGVAVLISAVGQITERDTITCHHCQAIVFVKPKTAALVYRIYDASTGQWRDEPGAGCMVCREPICLRCQKTGGCTPFERQLEVSEARDRLRRQAAECFH